MCLSGTIIVRTGDDRRVESFSVLQVVVSGHSMSEVLVKGGQWLPNFLCRILHPPCLVGLLTRSDCEDRRYSCFIRVGSCCPISVRSAHFNTVGRTASNQISTSQLESCV